MLRVVKAGNLPCRALSRFCRDERFGELEAARQPLQNGLGNLCAAGGQGGLPGLGAGEFRDGVHDQKEIDASLALRIKAHRYLKLHCRGWIGTEFFHPAIISKQLTSKTVT